MESLQNDFGATLRTNVAVKDAQQGLQNGPGR